MYNMQGNLEDIWVKIPGFYNYSVSSGGQIYDHRIEKILEGKIDSTGHVKVLLWQNSQPWSAYIYILVASLFLPRYSPSNKTLHRDGDRTNNDISNLYQESTKIEVPIVEYSPPGSSASGRRAMEVVIVETGQVFKDAREVAEYLGRSMKSVYRNLAGKESKKVAGVTLKYLNDNRIDSFVKGRHH